MVEARFKLRHPRLKDFSWHWKPFGFTLVLAHARQRCNRRSRSSSQIKNKLYRWGRNSPLKPDARIQGPCLSRERPQAASVCCLGSTRAKTIFWHGKPPGFTLVLRTRC
jgi:hypothetical protein